MTHKVIFAPEALQHLSDLQYFIETQASSTVAEKYVSAIVDTCEDLSHFPLVGAARDDIRKGLRVTHYKGRAIIAFSFDANQVDILGVFYGGMDWESFFAD